MKGLFAIFTVLFLVGCGDGDLKSAKKVVLEKQQITFEQGLESILQKVDSKLVSKSKIKIAVLNFANEDNKLTTLGVEISKKLNHKFLKMKKFDIMKRKNFISILNFNNISAHGNLTKKMLEEIAWMIDVDVILTGVTKNLDKNNLEINSKLFLAKNAKMIDSYSVRIKKDNQLTAFNNKILNLNPREEYRVLTDNANKNHIALSPREKIQKNIVILRQSKLPKVRKIRY